MSVVSKAPRQLLCSTFRQRSLMASMTKVFSTSGQICSENKDDQGKKENNDQSQSTTDNKPSKLVKAACVVGGGALVLGAAPFALSAAGFTATGITTGTLAASMQSMPVVGAYVVPTLQSLGAGGLGAGGTAVFSAAGGYVGAKAHNSYHFLKKKFGKGTGGGGNGGGGNDGGSGNPQDRMKSKL